MELGRRRFLRKRLALRRLFECRQYCYGGSTSDRYIYASTWGRSCSNLQIILSHAASNIDIELRVTLELPRDLACLSLGTCFSYEVFYAGRTERTIVARRNMNSMLAPYICLLTLEQCQNLLNVLSVSSLRILSIICSIQESKYLAFFPLACMGINHMSNNLESDSRVIYELSMFLAHSYLGHCLYTIAERC